MHQTIVAVDVERFGVRDSSHQAKVRVALSIAMEKAFDRCGLDWNDCHVEDRGDGLFVLLPADTDNRRLAECLPNELAGRLREHNATADREAKVRLRIVLHSGEIRHDRQGQSGRAVVFAFRLLDAKVLRKALRRSRGVLALITSTEFFRDVIEPDPVANPDIYRQVRVVVKETRAHAMVCLPDHQGVVRERWFKQRWMRVPSRDRLAVWSAYLAALLLAGGVHGDAPPDDSCGDPVQLNVNVSAEKARVIEELAGEFESDSRDEHGCKTVTVQVTVARSADAVIAAIKRGWTGQNDLRDEGPQPHVLLPDSSVEYHAAVQALVRRTHVTLDSLGSIASSPLVLARLLPEGAEPGTAEPFDSWKDVLDTARRGTRMYRPSPVSSGAGLVATVALYSAALGKAWNGETFDDHSTLHEVELAVAAGGDSGTLLCSLWKRRSDARVVVSEKAAADFNEESPPGGLCAPEDGARFELTYPGEGTPYLDHPFVAVRWHEPPMNPSRERAVRRFHEFLTGHQGRDALRRARLRDENDVTTPFTGAPDGPPPRQTIGRVDVPALFDAFHHARKEARVQLLVDVSRAMAEPFPDVGGTRLSTAADAVNRTLRGGDDQVGLWEFAAGLGGDVDHRVRVPLGPGSVGEVLRVLETLEDHDREARLHGTLRAAVAGLRALADTSEETSDAVVIVAGGSPIELDRAVLDFLVHGGRPVPVFLIAFGTQVCDRPPWNVVIPETGGTCHEVDDLAGIDRALDSVATVLWGGRT